MKKVFESVAVLVCCGIIIFYRQPIAKFFYKNFIHNQDIAVPDVTSYKKDIDLSFVKNTNDFSPKNRQDILNILYTIINSGWNEFSFYCDDSYKECTNEVQKVIEDEELLSNINNFVHPYNTYETISISINNFNLVTVQIEKTYSSTEIFEIDKKVEQIYKENIEDTMSDYDKVKKIHDYIINHTVYDSKKEKITVDGKKVYKNKSNLAYGPLINGVALCGGYTDAMALFLEKMNIPNYRISSENHIWNFVYINGKWKHLDLTWDDPVTSSGENTITHNFFLINTSALKNLDREQHNFNENTYIEAK